MGTFGWLNFFAGLLILAWYTLAYLVAWRRTKIRSWLWAAIGSGISVVFYGWVGLYGSPQANPEFQVMMGILPCIAYIELFKSLRGQATDGYHDSLDLILLRQPYPASVKHDISKNLFVPRIQGKIGWTELTQVRRLAAIGALVIAITIPLYNIYHYIQETF
jgi:hypothetical protein